MAIDYRSRSWVESALSVVGARRGRCQNIAIWLTNERAGLGIACWYMIYAWGLDGTRAEMQDRGSLSGSQTSFGQAASREKIIQLNARKTTRHFRRRFRRKRDPGRERQPW